MATIEQLRTKFDTLTTAQKMQFALGIKAQIIESNNEEHKQFYNECVEKYNAELKSSALPEADEDLLQLVKQEELPDAETPVALEKLHEKPGKMATLKNIPFTAVSFMKNTITKFTSIFKILKKKDKDL